MNKVTRLFKQVGIIAGACFLIVTTNANRATAQPGVTVSFQTFYDDLQPYGQWVDDAQYGNVWVPDEGNDFRPYYSHGHWAMTDYGNTWVSDDNWGWATYHYGRWTYNNYYGWVWVPGYDWAPAWVDWRYGGGQCGWAPLAPGISVGVSYYSCPDDWWVFVGPQYLYRNDFYHNWRGPRYNANYLRQTTVYNNTYVDNSTHVRYNYGPRSGDIQNVTHQPVQVYHLTGGSRPGAPTVGGKNIKMYRPLVNRATVNTAKPGNVVRAPHPVGRPTASNTAIGTQPPFRSVMHTERTPQQANPQVRQNTTPRSNQIQPINRTQPQAGRNQTITNQNNRTPQPGNRVQPQANTNRPQQQSGNRMQPQNNYNSRPQQINRPQQPANHAQPQQPNRQQMNNNHSQQQQQVNRQQQQQMNRPQQQQQMNRPQPQMNRPQPQQQMNRPQPMQQPQMSHPQGGGQAPAPHMEGGRR